MSVKPKCFIIMPLTTPVEHIINYANDDKHFKHVLEHLFLPAVEQAGFEPIKPIAKGSENIQALIIKKLETADLVLCDMSILNPNVFFEFGIRTALNKPICVVVDDKTHKVPFDTGTINYYRYNSSMLKWDVEVEIENLINHIKESKEQIEEGNALWKYFGLTNVAKPIEPKKGEDGKLDYLMSQMSLIVKRLDNFSVEKEREFISSKEQNIRNMIIEEISEILDKMDIKSYEIVWGKGNSILIAFDKVLATIEQHEILRKLRDYGIMDKYTVSFTYGKTSPRGRIKIL